MNKDYGTNASRLLGAETTQCVNRPLSEAYAEAIADGVGLLNFVQIV